MRCRMATERMKHAPVRLTKEMVHVVVAAIVECVRISAGGLAIAAAAIESTHAHLLIAYSGRDIDKTAKWLADRTTKAVHRETNHHGPVWCKGKWCSYVFDESHWQGAIDYIERHNTRQGREARPYPFLM